MNTAAVRIVGLGLAVLVSFVGQVWADGFIHIIPQPGQPAAIPLAMTYHKVSINIDHPVARTLVDEEFFNPNGRVLEGTYLFPVPRGAVIDKFSLFIDGKETPAELLGAGEARKIYEDIVRKMRDPALLEYADRDLFKVRVYPIPARGTRRIKISYDQVLKTDNQMCRYVYPLNVEKFASEPIKSVSVQSTIRSKTPIKNVYCPTHAMEISRKSDREVLVGYEARDVKPDRDVELVYGLDERDVGVNFLTFQPAGKDGYFLCLLSPKFEIAEKQEIAKDVCFVLDTSGSMADDNKLEQARKALEFCLKNLGPKDRFNIVRFSTTAEKLFPKLELYRDHIDPTHDYLSKLKPLGGTNINDALAEALKLRDGSSRPFLIIFITDGQPTVGVTNVSEILANVKTVNQAGTRIFCFGVGYDVNTNLLDSMADATRAVSQYVKPKEDMEIKVSDFFAKVKDPVLTQLAIRFEGIKVRDVYPQQLPDLFRGTQLALAGRFEGPGPVTIHLEGKINDKLQKFAYKADGKAKPGENEFIPRLWATQKVAFLLDQIRQHGQNKELIDETTALAKEHGIVTPYTSYLILEDERKIAQTSGRAGGVQFLPASSPKAYMNSKERFKAFASRTTGQDAVEVSEHLQAMKSFNMAAPNSEPMADSYQGEKDISAAKVRTVGEKTFFFNGISWVDTQINPRKPQKKVKLVYLSDEYFSLLKNHPQMGKFLALGEQVMVSFEGATYEITK